MGTNAKAELRKPNISLSHTENYLLATEHFDYRLPRAGIHELESVDVQVLPDDECLHCSHFQACEGVLYAKYIFAGVLADLIKEFADEALLLHKLYIRQCVG